MVTLTIPNLEDAVVAALKARAKRHKRSLEAEVRELLRRGDLRVASVSAGSGRSYRGTDARYAADGQHPAGPCRPRAMTVVVDASDGARLIKAPQEQTLTGIRCFSARG
jgi:hypothetical protein